MAVRIQDLIRILIPAIQIRDIDRYFAGVFITRIQHVYGSDRIRSVFTDTVILVIREFIHP